MRAPPAGEERTALTRLRSLVWNDDTHRLQMPLRVLAGIGMGAVRLRTGNLWPLIAAHFLVDGPERLVFGEQATTATPIILGLLLAAGIV